MAVGCHDSEVWSEIFADRCTFGGGFDDDEVGFLMIWIFSSLEFWFFGISFCCSSHERVRGDKYLRDYRQWEERNQGERKRAKITCVLVVNVYNENILLL